MYIINRDKLYELKGSKSVANMSKDTGVDLKTLQMIFNGKNKMFASQNLLKVCDYYGIVDVRDVLIKIV